MDFLSEVKGTVAAVERSLLDLTLRHTNNLIPCLPSSTSTNQPLPRAVRLSLNSLDRILSSKVVSTMDGIDPKSNEEWAKPWGELAARSAIQSSLAQVLSVEGELHAAVEANERSLCTRPYLSASGLPFPSLVVPESGSG